MLYSEPYNYFGGKSARGLIQLPLDPGSYFSNAYLVIYLFIYLFFRFNGECMNTGTCSTIPAGIATNGNL
jgi:hypothetical protein